MERFLRNDFTDQLTREKSSVEEALTALQNARHLNHNQSAARVATLSVLRQRLDYFQNELEKVLKAATIPAFTDESTPEGDEANSLDPEGVWADA